MSEASGTAFRLAQDRHFHQLRLFVTGDDHLSDTFAVFHDKVLLREVDEDDAHFSAIVCIHSAGVFNTVIPFFRARPLRGLT